MKRQIWKGVLELESRYSAGSQTLCILLLHMLRNVVRGLSIYLPRLLHQTHFFVQYFVLIK